MEDSSTMFKGTIYTMYKGRDRGDLDVVNHIVASWPALRRTWMETSSLRALTLSATWYTWAREVGRVGLQQNLLPWDITNDMRKLLMTVLGIQ